MDDLSLEPLKREVNLQHLAHKTAARYCSSCNIQEQCESFNPAPKAECTIDLDSDFKDGVTVIKVQEAMLDLVSSVIIDARMLLLQNKSLNINNPKKKKNIDTIMKMIERISKTSLFQAMSVKVQETESKVLAEVVVPPPAPKSVFERLLMGEKI